MAVYCDKLNKRVLLDLQSLTAIQGDNGRLSLSYQCVCGRKGNMLTGRDRLAGGMSGHILE